MFMDMMRIPLKLLSGSIPPLADLVGWPFVPHIRAILGPVISPSRIPTRNPWLLNETANSPRSEEHTSELQSPYELACRLLLEKKNPLCALFSPATLAIAAVLGGPFVLLRFYTLLCPASLGFDKPSMHELHACSCERRRYLADW